MTLTPLGHPTARPVREQSLILGTMLGPVSGLSPSLRSLSFLRSETKAATRPPCKVSERQAYSSSLPGSRWKPRASDPPMSPGHRGGAGLWAARPWRPSTWPARITAECAGRKGRLSGRLREASVPTQEVPGCPCCWLAGKEWSLLCGVGGGGGSKVLSRENG